MHPHPCSDLDHTSPPANTNRPPSKALLDNRQQLEPIPACPQSRRATETSNSGWPKPTTVAHQLASGRRRSPVTGQPSSCRTDEVGSSRSRPALRAGLSDTGSLRGDLLTRLLPWLRQLNRKPYARVVAGLVAEAQTNHEFAELYRSHFVQARRDATRELLLRARDRGEIALDTDLDVTLDLLYGPIYHRLLHGHAPAQFAQQVIEYVIAAITEKGGTRSQ